MKGGTMLYPARCQEMFDPGTASVRRTTAVFLGIDGLICCGGDGPFRGAGAVPAGCALCLRYRHH